MSHFLTLQSVENVLDCLGDFKTLEAEELLLESCFNRVLAYPLLAQENLPGFPRSTMDGFAVRAKDVFGASEGMPALLDCLGECRMGEVPDLSIGLGQTARIWTGGMLPRGADAVVMLEYAREAGGNMVELTKPAAPYENIITEDEDAEKGQLLLPAGRILRPQELGLLAALGHDKVFVRRKPRVAIISSGDEVVPVASRLKPGQVRDINSYTLSAVVMAEGGQARSFGIARDNKDELAKLVSETLRWADIVLVSGGSSAGQRDFTIHALNSVPGTEILAHGVAISPGKPLIMAKNNQKSLWGLPGHAASALVCAEVFIKPLIKTLLGVRLHEPWEAGLRAVLDRPVASAQGRRDYIRVRLSLPKTPEGLPSATPVMGKSGLITTLTEAEGLVVCPEDQEGLAAGQVVNLHLLS